MRSVGAHSRNISIELLAVFRCVASIDRSWNFKCALRSRDQKSGMGSKVKQITAQRIDLIAYSRIEDITLRRQFFAQIFHRRRHWTFFFRQNHIYSRYVRYSTTLPVWFATSYINKSHEYFAQRFIFRFFINIHDLTRQNMRKKTSANRFILFSLFAIEQVANNTNNRSNWTFRQPINWIDHFAPFIQHFFGFFTISIQLKIR